MQRPPLFESDGFIYLKNRFETYVKSKDLDLWHVIIYGDFPPTQNNPETKKDEIVPFDKQSDDLKKRLAKNNKAKMKSFQRNKDDKNGKSERKCFRCGDPNHLIGECPKPPRSKNQKAFVGGSWSDSGEDEEEKIKDKMCLVAQTSNEICLGINLEPDEWIKDSGCSKHMMGNRKLFSTYKAYNGGNVIFGSNLRGNIIGKGTISHDFLLIENVEHIDNLRFNLLSVGQICDNKCLSNMIAK
ncbi:retrovirus-related pol polyprotein from transposon TNT 1-94 [Tanacetum coccineum]